MWSLPSKRKPKRLLRLRRGWPRLTSWEAADQKVEVLKKKVEESNTKLAQALSVIMAQDEELGATKKRLESTTA